MTKDKEWMQIEIERLYDAWKHTDASTKHLVEEIKYKVAVLDEQMKMKIPKFVADYYERWNGTGLSFKGWFTDVPLSGDCERKTFEWLNDAHYATNLQKHAILADIIAHGLGDYEVEEDLYYVLNHENRTMLYKQRDNLVATSSGIYLVDVEDDCLETYQLTMAEIEATDPNYVPFAKPVKDFA